MRVNGNFFALLLIVLGLVMMAATPAMAQGDTENGDTVKAQTTFLDSVGAKGLGGGIGAGLVVMVQVRKAV